MSRIRSLKPEILEDAVTAALSDVAFRTFVGFILLADDYGRLRAEPGWLLGQIFWSRDPSREFREAFREALSELTRGRLVTFYELDGQRYAEIRNWAKHQKVDHPGKPRVPAPAEHDAPPPSREPRETLAPDQDQDPEEDLGSGSPTPSEITRARTRAPAESVVLPRADLPLPPELRELAQAQIDPSGQRVDVEREWALFLADREEKRMPVSSASWRKWVIRAIGFADRERRRESDRKASYQARFGKAPGLLAHETSPKPSAEDSRKFTTGLAAMLLEKQKETA